MSSLNKIVLVGTVDSEPDVKATTTGDLVVNFTLSVQRPPRTDGIQTAPDKLRIVGWRRLADMASQYPEGTLVVVDGRIQTRHYDNQEGQRIYITEVDAKEIRPLTGTPQVAPQVQPTAASTIAVNDIPTIEPKAAQSNTNFDFEEAGSAKAPEGDLSLPPEFGDEVEEDIPF